MTNKFGQVEAPDVHRQYRLIAVDLDSVEQARALAKEIADRSGRTVTVSDADGEVLGIFKGAAKN